MSKRARTAWMIFGGFGVAVAVAGVALLFAFRDAATPVDEESINVTVITGGGRPGDYGLYTYETVGYESTDALAGARHDYPPRTYLTIQPGGCGTLVRWQPLQQRYDEWDYCPDGSLAGWSSFNEWFGVENTDRWACPEGTSVQGEPGASWTAECTRPGAEETDPGTSTSSFEVLGYETLIVGGEEVRTLHVRAHEVESGGTEGFGTIDRWFLPGTPLPVRYVEEHSSTSRSRIGAVQYFETIEMQLVSLRPSSG